MNNTGQDLIEHEEHTNRGLTIDSRKCRLCLYCVQLCPSKAVKLEKDTIKVIPERCILCASCIKGCPQHAMSLYGGLGTVGSVLASGAKTIACLDPAFPAAFDAESPRRFVTALKKLGFTEVWEGAFGVELVSQAYRRLLDSNTGSPLISSFCPAIVFYIQKYLPQLIPNLAPIVSPMIAIGKVARHIKGNDWKTIYITPCLAQVGESVADEVAGVIDHVITFRDVQRMLDAAGIDQGKLEETEFDGPRPFLGRIMPVIGGLNRSMGSSFDVLEDEVSVAYGRRQVIGLLNQLASGYIRAGFLDLVYCDGCIDGPFIDRELSVLGRRHVIARYTKGEMAKQNMSDVHKELEKYQGIDLGREFRNTEEKLTAPSEEEIETILKKIDKLPPSNNLDCRACGYATCRDKAIAVAQGLADAQFCLPYLLDQSNKIYQQLEKSHRELQKSHQELEHAQYQLIRTEKLAALGQLAAGVAHEINNPLGTITIYAHILLKTMETEDPRRDDIALIINEANRTKGIVQGLLSFARETKLKPGDTDINELLEDALGLLVNQSLFQNIKIKKNFAKDLPAIFADGTQLKQVFLNIVLNAAQAMEGKGNLAITTWLQKDHIKIRIRDTGPGILPEHVAKLFNPFFTTKEKGTGLGLAISYGIIERHSGKIEVDTELERGSTFTISLPLGRDEKDLQDETKRH
ncbi:MAG TPA: [Fe-Fe] hydrogenase large subunit C-terminal domain-containing protein [Syntrophorhabdaceae bacterium]|nr:[Fe-Fe] hydrogenase large subunit C-terminal domain-containing protein [Syntrophorhabdaceae bacterium]